MCCFIAVLECTLTQSTITHKNKKQIKILQTDYEITL